MKQGDKISWTYRHHFNSRSSALRAKKGIFIKELKNDKARVFLNGNKNPSTVLIEDLLKL